MQSVEVPVKSTDMVVKDVKTQTRYAVNLTSSIKHITTTDGMVFKIYPYVLKTMVKVNSTFEAQGVVEKRRFVRVR